jgi:hypothetical protein
MKSKILILIVVIALSACIKKPAVKLDWNESPERLPLEEILDITDPERQAYHMYRYVKQQILNYTQMYKERMELNKEEWNRIDRKINEAKKLADGRNYRNAIGQFKEIAEESSSLAAETKKIVSKERQNPESCPEDRERYYQANRAIHSGNLAKALEFFYLLKNSRCLGEDDEIVKNASAYIIKRQKEIRATFQKWDIEQQEIKKFAGELTQIHKELKIIQKHQPQWTELLEEDYPRFFNLDDRQTQINAREENNGTGEEEPGQIDNIDDEIGQEEPAKEPAPFYPIAIDIWQSAWAEEFAIEKMEPLFQYLRRNNIKTVNLNPGLPMSPEPEFQQQLVEKLKPLITAFHDAGVEKINYLYAELNYPIGGYREFLENHPELGIDIMVDDSEFTDFFKNRFQDNKEQYRDSNIGYSAFITLESVGNSGVSDDLRYWVLENIDYPILMSYFGCTLEKQKEMLQKYLEHAEEIGKKKSIGIAILLGSKKVGREESCERKLSEFELQAFIRDLHDWASQYESYGGIVLETNQRFPGVDVYLEHNEIENKNGPPITRISTNDKK